VLGGERLRRNVVDVVVLDLCSGALTRPRADWPVARCRSLLRPSACWKLDGRKTIKESFSSNWSSRSCRYSSGNVTLSLPPSDHGAKACAVGRGDIHRGCFDGSIGTDPALRTAAGGFPRPASLPYLDLTTPEMWVRGCPAGCDKQSGHPLGLAALGWSCGSNGYGRSGLPPSSRGRH
jgi:hypothetical protein